MLLTAPIFVFVFLLEVGRQTAGFPARRAATEWATETNTPPSQQAYTTVEHPDPAPTATPKELNPPSLDPTASPDIAPIHTDIFDRVEPSPWFRQPIDPYNPGDFPAYGYDSYPARFPDPLFSDGRGDVFDPYSASNNPFAEPTDPYDYGRPSIDFGWDPTFQGGPYGPSYIDPSFFPPGWDSPADASGYSVNADTRVSDFPGDLSGGSYISPNSLPPGVYHAPGSFGVRDDWDIDCVTVGVTCASAKGCLLNVAKEDICDELFTIGSGGFIDPLSTASIGVRRGGRFDVTLLQAAGTSKQLEPYSLDVPAQGQFTSCSFTIGLKEDGSEGSVIWHCDTQNGQPFGSMASTAIGSGGFNGLVPASPFGPEPGPFGTEPDPFGRGDIFSGSSFGGTPDIYGGTMGGGMAGSPGRFGGLAMGGSGLIFGTGSGGAGFGEFSGSGFGEAGHGRGGFGMMGGAVSGDEFSGSGFGESGQARGGFGTMGDSFAGDSGLSDEFSGEGQFNAGKGSDIFSTADSTEFHPDGLKTDGEEVIGKNEGEDTVKGGGEIDKPGEVPKPSQVPEKSVRRQGEKDKGSGKE